MSQAKPGSAKVSQDEPKRREKAKQSQGVHEFWRVMLGLGASSGEFCWDLERGGGQDEPSEARMSQGEPGLAQEERRSQAEPGGPQLVLASSAGTWG